MNKLKVCFHNDRIMVETLQAIALNNPRLTAEIIKLIEENETPIDGDKVEVKEMKDLYLEFDKRNQHMDESEKNRHFYDFIRTVMDSSSFNLDDEYYAFLSHMGANGQYQSFNLNPNKDGRRPCGESCIVMALALHLVRNQELIPDELMLALEGNDDVRREGVEAVYTLKVEGKHLTITPHGTADIQIEALKEWGINRLDICGAVLTFESDNTTCEITPPLGREDDDIYQQSW